MRASVNKYRCVSEDAYLYVEYAALALVKEKIEEAGMDPSMFFNDLGPTFQEASVSPDDKNGNTDLSFAGFLALSTRLLWLGTGGTIGNLHFDRQVGFEYGRGDRAARPSCSSSHCFFHASLIVVTGKPHGCVARLQNLHPL